VIGYNKSSQKFIVELPNNSVKEVVRLSIMFNEEDSMAFKERVQLAKQLQTNA